MEEFMCIDRKVYCDGELLKEYDTIAEARAFMDAIAMSLGEVEGGIQ